MSELDNLIDTLTADGAPVELAPSPYWLGLKWLAAVTAYLVLALVLTGLRPDLGRALGQPWFVAELSALTLIVIASSLSAAVLAFPDLHQKRCLAFAPLGAFALCVGVLVIAWRTDTPAAPLPVHDIECTLSITMMSLLPAGWTFFSLRQLASTHARWAGSATVLGAFAVGALWLRLHEINDSVAHVVEWHYLPMLVAGIAGFWLGKRFLRW